MNINYTRQGMCSKQSVLVMYACRSSRVSAYRWILEAAFGIRSFFKDSDSKNNNTFSNEEWIYVVFVFWMTSSGISEHS
jgi:hypothetical protein